MSYIERFEDPGSFSLPLRAGTTPLDDVLERIEVNGMILVHPQWHPNYRLFSDQQLMDNSIYGGVVIRPRLATEVHTIAGAGVWWWLGDREGKGQMVEEAVFVAAPLSDILIPIGAGGVLPNEVLPGIVVDTGLPTYTGNFNYKTPLECIRTVFQTLGAHGRMNPNCTLDACSIERDDVFNMTDPRIVVTRHHWGSDPNYIGVEALRMATVRDSTSWANRAVALEEDGDGVVTVVGDVLNGDETYYGPHGLPIERTIRFRRSPSDVAGVIDSFLEGELSSRPVANHLEADARQHEAIRGRWPVGDTVWAFDHATRFGDRTQQIPYRGQHLGPRAARLWSADVPWTYGQGILYRPPLATVTSSDYIDLTPHIDWQVGAVTRLEISWLPEFSAPCC